MLGSNTAPVASGSGGASEEGDEWAHKLSGKALKVSPHLEQSLRDEATQGFTLLTRLPSRLQYSFTREIEIISSTLQPPSTVHSFSFELATPESTSKGGVAMHTDLHQRSSTSSTKDGL